MQYLFILVTAIAVSIAVIPVMIRLAPWLGMVDHPDSRKVHVNPIPRVGGWGIVLGALVSIFIWLPVDRLLLSYIFGSLVLLIFGAWDDRQQIGHYTKFIGQFIAVLPMVTYGGLYVTSFPFMETDAISSVIAIPFTMIAMVGVINAINHSDGLDGLAGGESLLSLGAIAFLAYLVGGELVIAMAVATIGGILGFLRFNTHPASVFMGDSGSQFLGFTLGFLLVLLTQHSSPTPSPAVVLLLLGLPPADILIVLMKRIRGGLNWFRATKNHVHHRLLELGFFHEESVIIIYSLQFLFIISAFLFYQESDWLIVFIYLAICSTFFLILNLAEKLGWMFNTNKKNILRQTIQLLRQNRLWVLGPRISLEIAIPLYFLVVSLGVSQIEDEFGIIAIPLFFLILIEPFLTERIRHILRRAFTYVVAAFVVYLSTNYSLMNEVLPEKFWVGFFGFLVFVIVAAIRFSPGRRSQEFRVTPMDYLITFTIFAAAIFIQSQLNEYLAIVFIVQLAIIFYGCEFLIVERRERWDTLRYSSLATVVVLAVRGLL